MIYKNQIKIKADISEVWDALVNPEKTKLYMFGCETISDWKVGSSLVWRGAADGVNYVIGNVVEFIPNKTLAFTVFDPNGKYEDVPENYLTTKYELTSQDGHTLLEVSQSDYSKVEDGQKRFEDSETGWNMTLQALKKVLED